MHARFLLLCAAAGLAVSFTVHGQELQVQRGGARLRFPGDASVPQQVEACGDLFSWDLLTAPITVSGAGMMEITEPAGAAGTLRFYRVLRGTGITVPRSVRTLIPLYGYGSGADSEPACLLYTSDAADE